MKTLPIEVEEGGRLRLPHTDESSGTLISALAEQSGTLALLKEEPEIYSDADILPGRGNPRFRK